MSKRNVPIIVICAVVILLRSAGFPCAEEVPLQTTAIEHFDFATGLFERGMYKMAGDEYKKFIIVYPQSEHLRDAYFGFAESLYFQKRYDEAMAEYGRYLEMYPSEDNQTLVVKLRIGEIFFFTKKFDDAISQFKSVEGKNYRRDQTQTLCYYLAKANRIKGIEAQAIHYFNKAARMVKNNEYAFNAFIELGDIYADGSEYEKALKYYGQARDSAATDQAKSFSIYKAAEMQFLSGDYENSTNTFKKVLADYPESEINAESLSNLLLALFNTKKYDELIKEYAAHRHLVKKEDRFFDAHFTACSAYAEVGDHDEALDKLTTLISSDWVSKENKDRAALKKSEILLLAKRFKEALDLINARLSNKEEYRDNVLFLKGEALYGAGDFDEAAAQFNRLIAEHPDSPFVIDAIYSLAYVRKNMDQGHGARELFIQFYERSKDSVKSQAALYNAILLDIKDRDLANAIKECKLYLSTFQEGQFREKILFTLGSVYAESNDFHNAISIYKEFIDDHKDSPRLQDAYFRLAYNLQMIDDFDGAIEYYGKLEYDGSVDGLYYAALKNEVLIYFAKDNKDKAAEAYDYIISDFPDNDLGMDGYFWIVKHYLESDRFADAIRILKKAEMRGGATDNVKEIAYFKAEAYREIEDLDKAVENYDIVLSGKGEADVYTGASRIGKGLCLVAAKEYDKAKEEFDMAIIENPDDNTVAMRAKFETAGIEFLKGDLEQSYKLYMMVAILYDDSEYCPRALLRAADIFKETGNMEEAKKAYREILDRYGKTEFAQEARVRLKDIRWKLND